MTKDKAMALGYTHFPHDADEIEMDVLCVESDSPYETMFTIHGNEGGFERECPHCHKKVSGKIVIVFDHDEVTQ